MEQIVRFVKYVPKGEVVRHLDDGWRVVDSFAGSDVVMMEFIDDLSDPLAPAKGIINGLALGLLLWFLIGIGITSLWVALW
jgi:hypothetical protein